MFQSTLKWFRMAAVAAVLSIGAIMVYAEDPSVVPPGPVNCRWQKIPVACEMCYQWGTYQWAACKNGYTGACYWGPVWMCDPPPSPPPGYENY
jgi:hypothetical protein